MRRVDFLRSNPAWAPAIGTALALSACSGSATTTLGGSPRAAELPAAIATGCIYPSVQTQTAQLPSAGGVSGTINIGGVAQASTTCLTVTVATGADASASATSVESSLARRRLASTPAVPQPLLEIALTNTYTGDLHEFFMTLQLPPGSVPAGKYPATITSTVDLGDGQVQTEFKLFTVTVSASGQAVVTGTSFAAGGGGALAVLSADTTGTLAIYPIGTVLPTPEPYPTEGPSPTPTPIPTLTVAPTATPTATPTPNPTPTLPFATSMPNPGSYGNPPPAYGSMIGTESFNDPYNGGICQDGQAPCDATGVPVEQQSEGGSLELPTGFSGSISYSVDIGYMDLQKPVTNTCASDWTITADLTGSGSITIPQNDYFGDQDTSQPQCTIIYTTLPPGASGSYYEEVLYIQGVSGVPCGANNCSTAVTRRRTIK